MAVKAKAEITLATIRDVQSVTRYYLLQSSTSSMPSKPTANPPGGSWVKTEPSYTSGSTNSLYFTDLTVFTDASFSYSDVSLSSSYEAAKAAYNKAVAAEGTASSALAQSVEYIVGTQTAATGSWKGVSTDAALYAGKTIAYKLPYAGSGNASLTLTLADGSATAAIPVYLNTTRVTTHFGAGCVINMTYDGTNWRAASIPNSNNYDRVLHNTAIKAAAAVTKAHLIAGNADGYKNLAASLMFDLAYPILYASADIAALYGDFFDHGISVVAANKIAASSDYAEYRRLKDLARKRGVKWLFETNVGAGLPIIGTINDLCNSGDRILKMEAVLSGTLNFIFNTLSADVPFSETVRMAKEQGFSEPDPRIDLSGKDVIRKLVILSREAGYEVNQEDVEKHLFIPQEFFDCSEEEFWAKLPSLDAGFEERRRALAAEGKRWRFVAKMEEGRLEVALRAVDSMHSFYVLDGSNNIILLTTERYRRYPMIIQGYGAGAEVTAAGVFADIMRVANI